MKPEQKQQINEHITEIAKNIEPNRDEYVSNVIRKFIEVYINESLEPEKPKKEGFVVWYEGINIYDKGVLNVEFQKGYVDLYVSDGDGEPLPNGKILRVNADGIISKFKGINPDLGIKIEYDGFVSENPYCLTQDQ